MTFKVRASRCATCIYSKRTPIIRRTVEDLENECRDERGFLQGHRICHHTESACCRGFRNRHKDDFPVGQIAQRLNAVEFTDEDQFPPPPKEKRDEENRDAACHRVAARRVRQHRNGRPGRGRGHHPPQE